MIFRQFLLIDISKLGEQIKLQLAFQGLKKLDNTEEDHLPTKNNKRKAEKAVDTSEETLPKAPKRCPNCHDYPSWGSSHRKKNKTSKEWEYSCLACKSLYLGPCPTMWKEKHPEDWKKEKEERILDKDAAKQKKKQENEILKEDKKKLLKVSKYVWLNM